MQQIIILCPYYNEEASFQIFAAAVENVVSKIQDIKFSFLIVNEGSLIMPKLRANCC